MISEIPTAFVSNTHETIAEVHRFFALLFSRLFSLDPSNPEREPQKGSSKWAGVKQRPIIGRKLLI